MVVILGAFPATIVLVTLLESDCACLHRPVAAGAGLVLFAGFTVVTWVRVHRGMAITRRWEAAGRGLLWLAAALGLGHMAGEIAHFV